MVNEMVKKSFKDNPALQFITTQPEEAEEGIKEVKPEPKQSATTEKPPEGYKLDPRYVETKSRRLQLLMQPSLHAKIKTMAKDQGVSVNEFIHSVLEEYTKGE
jgi:hypothetical protein